MARPLLSAAPLAAAHPWRRSCQNVVSTIVGLVTICNCAIPWTPAGANEPQMYAVDQISRSYEISITNPADHRDFPAVLLVQNAQLTTINPNGSGVAAQKGEIYLVL